jgi:hypothetical protein
MPANDEPSLVARSLQLLDRTEASARPVRLLGVNVHNLVSAPGPAQLSDRDSGRLPFEEAPGAPAPPRSLAVESKAVHRGDRDTC